VRVELLYFDGCPNWITLKRRLTEALAATGHGDVAITFKRVQTPEEAAVCEFAGSPTLRIDGQDPFLRSADAVGLSCRVYKTPDGLAGSPTVEQLVEVLNQAS
jgi:predicted Zn-dependent protease